MKKYRIFSLLILSGALAQAGEIAVIGHPTLGPSALDQSTVADIFLGHRRRLDGEVIKVADQKEGGDLRNRFYQGIARRSPTQMKAYWAQQVFTGKGLPPLSQDDNAAVKKWVAATPGAMGYVDKDSADSSVKILFTFNPEAP